MQLTEDEEKIIEILRKSNIESEIKILEAGYTDSIKFNAKGSKAQAKFELNKELVDLYLLIESYIEQTDQHDLIEDRIKRFVEKANGN